ncbi:MAG: hypothetical protein JNN28_05775 [Saprospiraceae bacterium]|nr:hypothetical protein [Saprospiraceae bacterium]
MEPSFNTNHDFSATESLLDQDVPTVDLETKAKQARRFQRGLKCMLGGAGLLVFSFGLNFIMFQSGANFEVPMYVLTSIGALVALKGMTDIFGI